MSLDYANRTGRPRGRLTRTLGLLLPGVRRVNAQVEPYADTWHARNLEALGRPGRRWIVLGDSMSQSVGASSVDAGWVGQLVARLGPLAPPVVLNLSATGARTGDVLDQQLPALAGLPRPPDAVDHDRPPDLVTVMVGSNDLFGGAPARTTLPAAFARLVAALPNGAVLTTLPQPSAAARAANRHADAAAGRLELVDLRTAGPDSWSGRLASDFFHPNDAGYAAIADAFEPVVRRVLDPDAR